MSTDAAAGVEFLVEEALLVAFEGAMSCAVLTSLDASLCASVSTRDGSVVDGRPTAEDMTSPSLFFASAMANNKNGGRGQVRQERKRPKGRRESLSRRAWAVARAVVDSRSVKCEYQGSIEEPNGA